MGNLLKIGVKWEWTLDLPKYRVRHTLIRRNDPKKDNYITTDACSTGLSARLWQKEGETLKQKQLPADS